MHFAWNKPPVGGILRRKDLQLSWALAPVWHILYGGGSVTGTDSGLVPGSRPNTQ